MARQPFQILVLPFIRDSHGAHQFAVFKRSDEHYWQGIAGGGESGEQPVDAAKREACEEAMIGADNPYYSLDTMFFVERSCFSAATEWPRDTVVIPSYSFAVELQSDQMKLSTEHTAYAWLPFEVAYDLVRYDGNKTALWELHYRLANGLLPKREGLANKPA